MDDEFLDLDNAGSVDVGFAEKCDPWKLESHFFPSKIGGKPAWLNFSHVPTADRVLCKTCKNPCIFLCQIYAPITSTDECFHRTLFLFVCRNEDCCEPNRSDNLVVLRCQLKRENEFFSFSPPVESKSFSPKCKVTDFTKTCRVCNLKGTSHCGKCQSVNYCCREHQVADWKAGHNSECSSGKADPQRKCPLMLPEWEIEIEAEELTDETREGNREKSEEEKMKEYENLIKEGKAGTMHGDSSADPDFDAMNEDKEDVVFKKFKKRIAATPDQVLRYEKDGEPLWVSQEHQPNAIPPCEYCGGERTFEFQILPQMLNHLSLDQIGKSIDWGTIAIFTCKESCDNGDAYKSEFVYKQDIVQ